MKKLISLLCLSLCCFAASAQPTSIGGITPGKTTGPELYGIATMADFRRNQDTWLMTLSQLENRSAFVSIANGVVYAVEMYASDELRQALVAKYGEPQIKVGKINTVTCQNQFGATFKRYEGEEHRLWPVKDGVQGGIESYTERECSEEISKRYVLRHVPTVEAMKEKKEDEARRQAENRRSKLGDAL